MKHEFLSFGTIGSTNDYLKERYRFFNDGLVCEADSQTKGRGRLGRVWEGEEGSLLFSLLLKDERKLSLSPLLPLLAGSALLKTFQSFGLSPSIKWPNDIYLGDKKVAGILVEGVYESKQEAAIIGIGINIANESFPASLPSATSLYLQSGTFFKKDEILSSFLSIFDSYLEDKIDGRDTFFLDIPSHDYLKGKTISFDYYKENVVGTSLGIERDGSIRIRDENGKEITIASGEANIRKPVTIQNQSEKGEIQMNPLDLEKYGIKGVTEVVYNPSYEELYEEEMKDTLTGYEKGQETELGAVNVMTGVFTGRSPKDKYIVMDENSKDTVWWNSEAYPNDNHPMSIEAWKAVKELAKKELSNKRLFVVDAYCGANKDTRMAVRFVVEVAWQAHFIRNMFIRPSEEELASFEPDFVVYNASKAKVENYKELGLHSETVVAFNITSKEQVILNTWYGGEMKKGMFSMMNYYLPLKGIASMHCSANTDMNGENTAIFFGLSGTGKTTLSTDPKRLLIGDDEHGWDDNGVFNFEGGCYAKVINLDKESEPDIYNAIRRDALLENVTVDENGKIDFADKSVTENTRVSYPIYHIKNIVKPVSHGPAAKNVIFLSADAFGVLPPVSILTPEQTQYYFLSGFTAKLAGTERGITTPTPTFSACFGQAFLELHPTKYAQELVKKMQKNGAKAYLVNTGWNGSGKRISIKDTRGIIDAILNGDILKAETKKIPYFDFEVPTSLPGVDSKILDPRDTYTNPLDWEKKAKDLAARFQKNFVKYENNEAGKALVKAGPTLD